MRNRKLLSLILAASMVFSMNSFAFAEEAVEATEIVGEAEALEETGAELGDSQQEDIDAPQGKHGAEKRAGFDILPAAMQHENVSMSKGIERSRDSINQTIFSTVIKLGFR